jgi:hypothetical protein
MQKRQKLTNSSDEASISDLISGDIVFSIPYFQRPYKWEPKRLVQLNNDILAVVDGRTDSHFLGAVIIYGRPSNPSDPKVYEVIDGQQRLTTIFLYLCGIVRTFCTMGEYAEAGSLFLKYLVISRNTSLFTNSKLQSCKDDRAQLNYVFASLMADEKFSVQVAPFKYLPLPATGTDRGRLRSNYQSALRFFEKEVEEAGIQRLRDIYRVLVEFLSVVQIDVWDPMNGPKIFDSLNSQQQPMTTGDLVRNEIFSKVAGRSPAEVEIIDQTSWQPFYLKFADNQSSLFDDYFFPYGLILNPNLKKSEVYSHLRDGWRKKEDPADIVKEIAVYQDAFLDLARGSNLKQLPPLASDAVNRLSEIIPSSTFPFLMQLLNGIADGTAGVTDGIGILELIESFLIRRAISGHEPTGLHAVFKRLWADCGGDISPATVEAVIRGHKTVVWPDSEDVKKSIRTRPLYGSSVTNFVLKQWNIYLGGDVVKIDFWIEHVLPEKPADGWLAFSKEEHESSKDLLANLLPLTQKMNQELSNGPYDVKRKVYQEDSCFKAARKFADDHEEWTPEALLKRSDRLADWAVARWRF